MVLFLRSDLHVDVHQVHEGQTASFLQFTRRGRQSRKNAGAARNVAAKEKHGLLGNFG